MKNVRRCLSFLLALVMLAGFTSGSALAGPEDNSDLIQNSDNQQEVHTDPPAGNDSGSEGKNLGGGGDAGGEGQALGGSDNGGQKKPLSREQKPPKVKTRVRKAQAAPPGRRRTPPPLEVQAIRAIRITQARKMTRKMLTSTPRDSA